MRILLISDTHDNLVVISELLEMIRREYIDRVYHCGDYVSPFVMKYLNKSSVKIIGVFGNNEGDKATILRFADPTKVSITEHPREIDIGDYRGLLIHGFGSIEQTKNIVYSIAQSGRYKYIFYGHTHKVDLTIVRDGKLIDMTEKLISNGKLIANNYEVIILNPGEASGWLTKNPTYIIFDTERKLIELKRFHFNW